MTLNDINVTYSHRLMVAHRLSLAPRPRPPADRACLNDSGPQSHDPDTGSDVSDRTTPFVRREQKS
jgi:hypothetical protein